MQYYPQACGYPNSTPPFPYNNPYNNFVVPTPSVPCPSPHVIGEGDVASVPLPDGGVQLYFVPRRPPLWSSWPEAWFIRSIPIPFPTYQQTLFSEQAQRVYSDQSLNHGEAENKASYQVKFHNDGATSTSDIHCFCPSLRAHNWFPKESVGTQAEPPRPPEPAPCSKPCLCSRNHSTGTNASKTHKNRMEVDVTCRCNESKSDKKDCHSNSSSSMSIEEHNIIYPDKSKNKKAAKKSEKYKDAKCECGAKKYDKGSATVTEEATSVEVGRETQATCGPGVPIRRVTSFLVDDAEVEFWYPKTPYSKKQLKSAESKASCGCGCTGASDSESSQNN